MCHFQTKCYMYTLYYLFWSDNTSYSFQSSIVSIYMQNVYYLYFIFVKCQLKYSGVMYFFYYIAHTLQFCQENSACCFQNINLLQFSSIVQICTIEISTIPRLFDNYEKKNKRNYPDYFDLRLALRQCCNTDIVNIKETPGFCQLPRSKVSDPLSYSQTLNRIGIV